MKKNKEKKAPKQGKAKNRPRGFHSINIKVVALVLVAIVVSVVSLLGLVIPITNNALSGLTDSYLTDVCSTGGKSLDDAFLRSGKIILNYDYMKNMFGQIQVSDLDSSYAYVLSADGTVVYHPDDTLLEQPLEVKELQNVVQQIADGEKIKEGVISYKYNGSTKNAAYYVSSNKMAILVVSADKHDILKSMDQILWFSVIAAVLIFVILGSSTYIIARRMIRPILEITGVVDSFAELDFTENPTTARISKRSDETGQMARAIGKLRERLVAIVSQIKNQSQLLYNASSELDTNASHTTTTVESVEAAVSEIANGATTQASETQKANDDILHMGNMIEHTNDQVENLTNTANLMRRSSDEAAKTLQELDYINKQALQSIDIIYEQTNTTNASAMKIQEATSLIASIAEETNLLSLNASIEAARAGEAGRGFAVVASQIQKLAEQSNNSTNQIDQIIRNLIDDSEKAVETMAQVKEIMTQQSENVHKTGLVFEQVRDGISHSISGVGEIATKTNQLDEARTDVVDVVQNLTSIAEQNAASTEETSASVLEVSNIMMEITENANHLKEIASVLEENMNEFKL